MLPWQRTGMNNGFSLIESLAAIAIVGILLLMVVGSAITLKRDSEGVHLHQAALLAIQSEADIIRVHHRTDLKDGKNLPFFTQSSFPSSLTHPVGIIICKKASEAGCLTVNLRLSWGKIKRDHETLTFLLCP